MKSRSVFLLATIPLVMLYAFTRAPSITGEDSGELTTAAYELGVAHPPGYPLWLMVTKTAQTVFRGAGPASAANLSSGLTTAVALGLLAVLAYQLCGSLIASLLGAWMVGVGHETWNHATITEVYPLTTALLAGCLLLYHAWSQAPSRRKLLKLSLLFGAGLTHHPSFQLLLPVFAVAIVWRSPRILKDAKTVGLSLLGLSLPFVVYSQVLLTAGMEPYASWGVKPEVSSVLDHFLRTIYSSAAEKKTPRSFGKMVEIAATFARFHVRELSVLGWVAGVSGLGVLVMRRKALGGLCLAGALVSGFGLIPLLDSDIQREDLFACRVFIMPAYLFLGLGIAVAAAKLFELVSRPRLRAALPALLLLPGLLAVSRFSEQDRSSYTWAEDYGRAIIEKLPKNALLLPGGDTSTFPLIYLQRCEGVRPDVHILDRCGTLERREALSLLPKNRREEYKDAPRQIIEEALVALSGHPVVFLRRRVFSRQSEMELVPFGLGFLPIRKGDKAGHERLEAFQSKFLSELSFRNETTPTVEDYTADVIQSHLEQVRALHFFKTGNPPAALAACRKAAQHAEGLKETLNNIGALLAENELTGPAEEYFRRALSIRGDYKLARRNLVVVLGRLGRDAEALVEAGRGLGVDPADEHLFREGVRAASQLGNGDAVRKICQLRMKAVPADPEPYRKLGRWALDHEGAIVEAMALFTKALDRDPQDQETQRALAAVKGRLGQDGALDLPGAEKPAGVSDLGAIAALLRPTGEGGTAYDDNSPPRKAGRLRRRAPRPPIPGGGDLDRLWTQARGTHVPNPLSGLINESSMPKTTPNNDSNSRMKL